MPRLLLRLFDVVFFCAYGRIDLAASLRTLTFWPLGDGISPILVLLT